MTNRYTWAEEREQIARIFNLWGVKQWEIQCEFWGQKADNWAQTKAQRAVYVKFGHPAGQMIQLKMDTEQRAIDNMQQLRLGLNEMRNIYRRGLENMVRTAYMQLDAPQMYRDPYEVLGVRSDAPMEDIEAMYVIKAKRAHPDAGGSDEAMKELNLAIERVRTEKRESA